MTQRDVSRQLGWGRDYVHQVLKGRVELKLEHLLKIADALGFSAAEIYAELAGNTPSVKGEGGRERADEITWGEIRKFVDESIRLLEGRMPPTSEPQVERVRERGSGRERGSERETS